LSGIVKISSGMSEGGTAEEIGAKAAILARVAALGLLVPPAFVLHIGLGAAMVVGDKDAERTFRAGLKEGIAFLEEKNRLVLRASPQTVAGLGPLRRGTLDAWHARHGA
jgi:hypothetical protein